MTGDKRRRRIIGGGIILASMVASLAATAHAADQGKESFAEIEIGAAGEWGLSNAGFSFGPAAAVEFAVIKDWLEIETGVTPLFGGGRIEWGTDFVLKKPFTLSNTVDFMVGAGPEWIHRTNTGAADSIAGEFVLEFQFWPAPERKFGWFLEPTYGYDFGRGHQQSLGMNVGLLIPIR